MEKKVFCRRPGSAALLYVTIMGKGYSNYYKEAEEEADLKTSKSPPAASTFFFRKLITLFEFAMFIFYIELKYSSAVQLSSIILFLLSMETQFESFRFGSIYQFVIELKVFSFNFMKEV